MHYVFIGSKMEKQKLKSCDSRVHFLASHVYSFCSEE